MTSNTYSLLLNLLIVGGGIGVALVLGNALVFVITLMLLQHFISAGAEQHDGTDTYANTRIGFTSDNQD